VAEGVIEFYTSWPTEKLTEILGEVNTGRVWATKASGELNHVRLLVDAAEAEGIVDDVRSRFSSDGTFGRFLLPVEASLPRPPTEKLPDTPGESPVEQEREALPPQRVSREELYADLTEGFRVRWTFVVMVALAAVVAAIGLMRDSATIIIAAMVIAPLLKPNLALALGTALGDLDLVRRAARVSLMGLAVALAMSVLTGAVIHFDSTTPELVARTRVDLADLLLAFASGVAAALPVTTAASSALIGVMVAVALMPPLVVAGLMLGAGELGPAARARELVAVNVVCINLAGVATFWAQRIVPARYWEASRARAATRTALLLWGILLVAFLLYIEFGTDRV
jgi:uncharacterized hydrophobic protein (TIGR00341 family)